MSKQFVRIEIQQPDPNQLANSLTNPVNDLMLLLLRFDSMTEISIISRKEVTFASDRKATISNKIVFEEYLSEGK